MSENVGATCGKCVLVMNRAKDRYKKSKESFYLQVAKYNKQARTRWKRKTERQKDKKDKKKTKKDKKRQKKTKKDKKDNKRFANQWPLGAGSLHLQINRNMFIALWSTWSILEKWEKAPYTSPHSFQKHKNSKSETFRGSYIQPRSMGKSTKIFTFYHVYPLPWTQKGKFWKNEKKPPTQVPKVSKNIKIQNLEPSGAPILNPKVWVKIPKFSLFTMFTPLPWGQKRQILEKWEKAPYTSTQSFQKHKNSKSGTFRGSYTQPRSMGKNHRNFHFLPCLPPSPGVGQKIFS